MAAALAAFAAALVAFDAPLAAAFAAAAAALSAARRASAAICSLVFMAGADLRAMELGEMAPVKIADRSAR